MGKTIKTLKDQSSRDLNAKQQIIDSLQTPNDRMRGSKRTQSESCLQTGMNSQTQITNLKNEIEQVMAELNAERESKQSMQRSKSCSETDFLSNLRNQSKEIKELKDKNEKMNETLNGNMTRYEQ